tara:strand:- start:9 stop:638 length:630 start_codon:yes stop_codon:yes gene_type:complete
MAKVITTELQHSGASSANITLAADGSVTLPSDTVDIATLSATGTASSSTFLRGDNAWASAGTDFKSFQAEQVTDQAHGTSAWNRIKFNAENWDNPTAYNTTTDTFTIPTTGKWWYKCSVKIKDIAVGCQVDIALFKSTDGGSNFVEQKKSGRRVINGGGVTMNYTVQSSGLMTLAQNDQCRWYLHHTNGSDRDLDDNWCLFEMFLLEGE